MTDLTWDGAAYAANTGHHRAHDREFLEGLSLPRDARILDVGCGAGDLTATLAEMVPDGLVVGMDPSPSMLEQARSRARPNQRFLRAAAQDLPAGVHRAFDAVVSRAVLHWLPIADHPTFLRGALEVLKPGGLLRLELGGAGNIPRVVALVEELTGAPHPWTFPDPGLYLDLLEVTGFQVPPGGVRLVAQRRHFTEESLRGWFDSQVGLALEEPVRAGVLARFDELVRHDGTWDQTYVRLDVRAFAPS